MYSRKRFSKFCKTCLSVYLCKETYKKKERIANESSKCMNFFLLFLLVLLLRFDSFFVYFVVCLDSHSISYRLCSHFRLLFLVHSVTVSFCLSVNEFCERYTFRSLSLSLSLFCIRPFSNGTHYLLTSHNHLSLGCVLHTSNYFQTIYFHSYLHTTCILFLTYMYIYTHRVE